MNRPSAGPQHPSRLEHHRGLVCPETGLCQRLNVFPVDVLEKLTPPGIEPFNSLSVVRIHLIP